jgi:hypothetical protein
MWRALESQLAGETPTRIPPEHAQLPLAAKATEPMDRRTGWGGAIRPSLRWPRAGQTDSKVQMEALIQVNFWRVSQ